MNVEEIRSEILKCSMLADGVPPLKVLLAKKVSRHLLILFARTLLAEENVMFWEDVQRFKVAEERVPLLGQIFDKYINPNSMTILNIAGAERNRLMKLYEVYGHDLISSPDLFDASLNA